MMNRRSSPEIRQSEQHLLRGGPANRPLADSCNLDNFQTTPGGVCKTTPYFHFPLSVRATLKQAGTTIPLRLLDRLGFVFLRTCGASEQIRHVPARSQDARAERISLQSDAAANRGGTSGPPS